MQHQFAWYPVSSGLGHPSLQHHTGHTNSHRIFTHFDHHYPSQFLGSTPYLYQPRANKPIKSTRIASNRPSNSFYWILAYSSVLGLAGLIMIMLHIRIDALKAPYSYTQYGFWNGVYNVALAIITIVKWNSQDVNFLLALLILSIVGILVNILGSVMLSLLGAGDYKTCFVVVNTPNAPLPATCATRSEIDIYWAMFTLGLISLILIIIYTVFVTRSFISKRRFIKHTQI